MTESTVPEQEKKTDELKPAGEGTILELPILPLRNTVIFPSGISPLTVGRPLSMAAAEAALATEEKLLGVVAQKTDGEGDPSHLESLPGWNNGRHKPDDALPG